MKVDNIIQVLRSSRIILLIAGLWFYVDKLLLNGNYQKVGDASGTAVYLPAFSLEQFAVIQTVPLFLLTIIGIRKFITILDIVKESEIPFHEQIAVILKSFGRLVLGCGIFSTAIGVYGMLNNFHGDVFVTRDLYLLFIPVEYAVLFFITVAISYILTLGTEIKKENEKFI